MNYKALAKKIYYTRVRNNFLNINYRTKNNKMWCVHSMVRPNYCDTIYDIENILIKYPQSIIKINTFNTQTDEFENDGLIITHLDD